MSADSVFSLSKERAAAAVEKAITELHDLLGDYETVQLWVRIQEPVRFFARLHSAQAVTEDVGANILRYTHAGHHRFACAPQVAMLEWLTGAFFRDHCRGNRCDDLRECFGTHGHFAVERDEEWLFTIGIE